jgi:hypothetical protein
LEAVEAAPEPTDTERVAATAAAAAELRAAATDEAASDAQAHVIAAIGAVAEDDDASVKGVPTDSPACPGPRCDS